MYWLYLAAAGVVGVFLYLLGTLVVAYEYYYTARYHGWHGCWALLLDVCTAPLWLIISCYMPPKPETFY
jgi:sugar phosphate permease